MSLSVLAFALVLSLLPRRYAFVAVGAVACAVAGFAQAFALVGPFPGLSGLALVVGSGASGTAVLAVLAGLDASLSFAPTEFSLSTP